jgi:hypothetical protein
MTANDPRTSATYDVLFFIAMLATALALGPALAHAFELPNKIGLGRDDYPAHRQIALIIAALRRAH